MSRATVVLLVAVGPGLILAACGDSTGLSTRVQSVEVTPANETVMVPATVQLTAVARDGAGEIVEGLQVVWEGDDPAVVRVHSNGLVEGRGRGATRVTARIDGIEGSAAITVIMPPAHVIVEPASDTRAINESTVFSAIVTDANGVPVPNPIVTWTSSAPNLATVDAHGVATAREPGTATVRAQVGSVAGTALLHVLASRISVRILEGDGQADTAGAVLPTAVLIEVRDETGAPLPSVEVWAGELYVDRPAVDDWPVDTTDALGRAAYAWIPGYQARVHQLRAGVYRKNEGRAPDLLAADTISALVTAASPYSVDFLPWDGITVFLQRTLDLVSVVGPVWDRYQNSVVVRSIAVDAAPPLNVNGTGVVSSVETDATTNIEVNGVPFPFPVRYRRDLRTMAGAIGGWVCDSPNGALTENPNVVILRRDVAVVVDSVNLRSDGEIYSFYLTANYHDTRSDGSVSDITEHMVKSVAVESQIPGSFAFGFGPAMVQTSTSPLRYDGDTEIFECGSWISNGGGPDSHQPFWLTLDQSP